jgi:hypothetical protein
MEATGYRGCVGPEREIRKEAFMLRGMAFPSRSRGRNWPQMSTFEMGGFSAVPTRCFTLVSKASRVE